MYFERFYIINVYSIDELIEATLLTQLQKEHSNAFLEKGDINEKETYY